MEEQAKKRKRESLKRTAKLHRSASTPARQVPAPEISNIEEIPKLTVSKLKALARKHKVDISKCLEKREMVDALTQVLADTLRPIPKAKTSTANTADASKARKPPVTRTNSLPTKPRPQTTESSKARTREQKEEPTAKKKKHKPAKGDDYSGKSVSQLKKIARSLNCDISTCVDKQSIVDLLKNWTPEKAAMAKKREEARKQKADKAAKAKSTKAAASGKKKAAPKKKLMERIRDALADDKKIKRFTDASKQLKKKTITEKQYFEYFVKIFGKHKTLLLFPDVVEKVKDKEQVRKLCKCFEDFVQQSQADAKEAEKKKAERKKTMAQEAKGQSQFEKVNDLMEQYKEDHTRVKIKQELSDYVDEWVKESGKIGKHYGDVRVMLSTLWDIYPHFEPPDKFKVDLLCSDLSSVKKLYYKASKAVHPDRVHAKKGDLLRKKVMAELVFQALATAFNRFQDTVG